MSSHKALIARHVTRKYAQKSVVDQVDLTLEPGKVTALLGQSGAGKSTLLRLFAGLERPDDGVISIGDTVLSDSKIMVPAEKRRIGLIFQDFALFPHLTAAQNIAFGLNTVSKQAALETASTWLDRINLQDRAGAYPHQLSGGEQQRVAIARALAPEPLAILMDEPFSGLDPALREDVRRTALSIIKTSGIPALLVTHHANEAMLSADHLAIMRAGQIVQQGSAEAVYTAPFDLETATALGPIITLEGRLDSEKPLIHTQFGTFSATPTPQNAPQKTDVIVGIRPEAVMLDAASDIRVKVIEARRNGPFMQLRIEREGLQIEICVPARNSPVIDSECGVRFDPVPCVITGL